VEFTTFTISTSADLASSVFAIDMDDDGDIDVLSASSFDNKIAWYESDEFQNFILHTISTGASNANSVLAIDMDGDGDIDVLSASIDDDKIAWYRNDSVVGVESISNEIPIDFSLNQNYPNPFNPTTTIQFSLPQNSYITLEVFNTLGEGVGVLASEELSAGSYNYSWDAYNLTSGVYFYQLNAGSFVETKKMLLMK
jgi:hypothetical protein